MEKTMIIDADKNNKMITRIPHRAQYALWMSRLSPSEIDAIKKEIRRLIRETGDEIATAGWLPGPDWTDTPFHPIYAKACRSNEDLSGMCFGLMVWVTLMEDDACWCFGHYKLNNLPIKSMTYFKV